MKVLALPTGPDRPSWASLLGAVPALYVFWDPVRSGALPLEWALTALTFLLFLGLLTVTAVHWANAQLLRKVCLAMALLAIAFSLYRPAGILYFIFVAGIGPVSMNGRVAHSAAIVGAAAATVAIVWWWRWPPDPMPYVVGVQCLLVGGALTLLVRQHIGVRRALKFAERERIARDLHDILGHTLSVIAIKAELAGRIVDSDPQRAKAEISDVEAVSRSALAEVREAISGFRVGDFRTELARAKATLETAGIHFDGRVAWAVLPDQREGVLALVLREAVTNVVRHAGAHCCRVTLEREGDMVRLVVQDDGRGGHHVAGLGIRGIKERVAAVGGRAIWRTEAGTELTVSLPVSADHGT